MRIVPAILIAAAVSALSSGAAHARAPFVMLPSMECVMGDKGCPSLSIKSDARAKTSPGELLRDKVGKGKGKAGGKTAAHGAASTGLFGPLPYRQDRAATRKLDVRLD